jgi:ParB/RepB/Spo0J family partition protein
MKVPIFHRSEYKYQLLPSLNKHEYEVLFNSIKEHGIIHPVEVDEDGNILDGHHRYSIAMELGIECPTIVRENMTEDEKHSYARSMNVARRHLNSKQKRAIIADALTENPGRSNNSIAKELGVSDTTVGSVRKELNLDSKVRIGDDGKSYTVDDSDLKVSRYVYDQILNKKSTGEVLKAKLDTSIDIIYCSSINDQLKHPAHDAGWKMGFQTDAVYKKENSMYEEIFIDIDFKNYRFDYHLENVKTFRPKYCTVIDIMTEDETAGYTTKFHTFDEVMEQAEQLNEYAENVIIIPKYDCIKDIPDNYILGYSCPSSYGMTSVDYKKFKGRKVHLLGGPWGVQRRYLQMMGEDVVSLDNNSMNRIAAVGSFYTTDGIRTSFYNLNYEFSDGFENRSTDIGIMAENVRFICASISFGNIIYDIARMNGYENPDREIQKNYFRSLNKH